MTEQRANLFERTINVVQALALVFVAVLTGSGSVGYFVVSQYNGMDRRIQAIENGAGPTATRIDDRFSRVEESVKETRDTTREQLSSISADIKDVNSKLGTLHDQLLLSSAGNRPDMKRWAK